jgi:GDPmannose 4,6-dehydratase
MKTALVTGITGQDGRHLTELLRAKNYKIIGVCRDKNAINSHNFQMFYPEVNLCSKPAELEGIQSELIDRYKPDEIYNLAALSSVSTSFKDPVQAANDNAIWAIKLFEACRKSEVSRSVRIYQAGSSEMFGSPRENPQSETTPFHPISPYGAAKVFAHNIAVQYREIYGMQISNGILYNHEGPYRSEDYVSRKITSNVSRIALGQIEKFHLGNIEGKRDWGYAGDYVVAMHSMLQASDSEDFVISTGKSHSVREFLQLTLEKAGLYGDVEKYVQIDDKLQRPADSKVLIGDSSKANLILGWRASTTFEELVELMLLNDLRILGKA